MKTVFLDSRKQLVDEVAAWLERSVQLSPAGARTLDHLLVVVPTRQAGRRLRLALAQRMGACIPPRILLPSHLLVPEGEPVAASVAERVSVLASLLGEVDLSASPTLFPAQAAVQPRSFSWRLGIARQLDEVWNILGENALTAADVTERAADGRVVFPLDEEAKRWSELSALEARYFARLGELGRCHPAEARRRAVDRPSLPEGVTEIVLPGLVDAHPAFFRALQRAVEQRNGLTVTVLLHAPEDERECFDDWGRPVPALWTAERAPAIPLRDEQCSLTANSAQQAAAAAALIDAVPARDELPGIGLADEALFPELQAAFIAKGKRLFNPAAMPLSSSSLGHIVAQVSQLLSQPSYAVFAAWLRESDTQRYFKRLFRQDVAFSFLDVLRALDALHKQHLPQTFKDVCAFCGSDPAWQSLRDVAAVVERWLDPQGRSRADHLRDLLREIFSARLLQERNPEDRELLAAAEALNEAVSAADGELVRRVLPDDADRSLLFDMLLSSAAYSLEPDDPGCILTDGWLELAWNPAAELVICGFNEESVPEAVVGHAFVPDSLRNMLGLTHNAQRTARDTYLFRSLLQAREPGAVTVFLERMNARGDVRKPSRLLFLCGDDDATFAARAIRLYQDSEKPASGFARSLPDGWRLKLPVPVWGEGAPPAGWPTVAKPEKLSVTAFKDYLACPFSFFLKHVLKLKQEDDRDRELDAMDFGSLCHSVLEAFGKASCDCRSSCDAGKIERFLHDELSRQMDARFGAARSTVLRLQEESLRQRLSFFSKLQAQLSDEGWRILQSERKAVIALHGMNVVGKIDRIDWHPEHGCRILDYKTWGKSGKEKSFCTQSKKDVARAIGSGLSTFSMSEKSKDAVWTDLQLPLYRRLVEKLGDVIPAGVSRFACGYLVLGDTEADTDLDVWDFDRLGKSADVAIKYVVDRVQAGIFWPIIKLSQDFVPLFPGKLEEGVAREWIADQESRLARLPPVTLPAQAERVVSGQPAQSRAAPAPKKTRGKGTQA